MSKAICIIPFHLFNTFLWGVLDGMEGLYEEGSSNSNIAKNKNKDINLFDQCLLQK